jgi:hypothetical protein
MMIQYDHTELGPIYCWILWDETLRLRGPEPPGSGKLAHPRKKGLLICNVPPHSPLSYELLHLHISSEA